ncbi:MAG: hypothetical protein HDQ88_02015 [Clostridia bacterium]|nr:hypothetical protein [Clostridia bacterium]
MEKFILGLAIGMAGGALVVANNCKLLNLVKKNQEDLMQKAECYIDKKLEELEQSTSKQDKKPAKSQQSN